MGFLTKQPQQATGREHRQGDKPERRFHLPGAVRHQAQTETADAIADIAPYGLCTAISIAKEQCGCQLVGTDIRR